MMAVNGKIGYDGNILKKEGIMAENIKIVVRV